MADWNKIKTEYVTTKISLRALAEKHGLNLATVGKKASAENWVEQRKQKEHKMQTKAVNKIIEQQAKATAKEILSIESIANELLEKAKQATEQLAKKEVITTKRNKGTGYNAKGQAIEVVTEEKTVNIVDGNIKVSDLKLLSDVLNNLDKLRQSAKLDRQDEIDPLSKALEEMARGL